MKSTLGTFTIAVAMLATMSSCGKSNRSETDSDSIDIASLPLELELKTASKSYEVISGDPAFTCYLTLKASIQWPLRIGDHDIKILQDTLMALALPDAHGNTIGERIQRYLTDARLYDLGDETRAIACVPEDASDIEDYYNNVRVTMLEVSDELATFRIDNEQYMGGAHPYQSSIPLSYCYSDNSIIDLAWLFKQGSLDELAIDVKASVASEAGISERELMSSLLTNGFIVSPTVYILNDEIYFHYDQYSLLPYSYGEIDAPISPYMVRDLLTEQAKKLLLNQ